MFELTNLRATNCQDAKGTLAIREHAFNVWQGRDIKCKTSHAALTDSSVKGCTPPLASNPFPSHHWHLLPSLHTILLHPSVVRHRLAWLPLVGCVSPSDSFAVERRLNKSLIQSLWYVPVPSSSCLGFPEKAQCQAGLPLWGRAQEPWTSHGEEWGSKVPWLRYTLGIAFLLFLQGAHLTPFCAAGDRLRHAEAPRRRWCKASTWCKASCWLSRQRGNIPPRGTVHGWENPSPETTLSWAEPWLSLPACFHQDVSRLQQGVKNEVLQVTCQPSRNQVYKE